MGHRGSQSCRITSTPCSEDPSHGPGDALELAQEVLPTLRRTEKSRRAPPSARACLVIFSARECTWTGLQLGDCDLKEDRSFSVEKLDTLRSMLATA